MTSSPEPTLERIARRIPVPGPAYERLLRRRDRKRRNRRSAAGVVGIAVFVTAVWVVTMGLPFGQNHMEGVPGGTRVLAHLIRHVETGPWDGYSAGGALHGSIPPEGVALSSPKVVELIARYSEFRVGFVLVYADGRVIWYLGRVQERRLTPEGIDLVRSGAVKPRAFLGSDSQDELPSSIWADPEARLYAPPRFAVCFSRTDDGGSEREAAPSQVLNLLPASAQALLRSEGEPRSYEALGNPPTECDELATEEARALQAILGDTGVLQDPVDPDLWSLPREGGGRVWIGFLPLFPDRVWHALPG